MEFRISGRDTGRHETRSWKTNAEGSDADMKFQMKPGPALVHHKTRSWQTDAERRDDTGRKDGAPDAM